MDKLNNQYRKENTINSQPLIIKRAPFYSKRSILQWTIFLFVMSVVCKFIVAYSSYSKIPSGDELFSIHGEIRDMFLGGDKTTWFYIQSNGSARRYYSFFGKVWPGMLNLKKGDVVDVLAWAEGGEAKYVPFAPGREQYYIWQFTKGAELIVSSEKVRVLKERCITEVGTFFDRLIPFSAILVALAYIRHLKILSKQQKNVERTGT